MGMGFVPTWLHQVSPPPLLHMTTLTTATKWNINYHSAVWLSSPSHPHYDFTVVDGALLAHPFHTSHAPLATTTGFNSQMHRKHANNWAPCRQAICRTGHALEVRSTNASVLSVNEGRSTATAGWGEEGEEDVSYCRQRRRGCARRWHLQFRITCSHTLSCHHWKLEMRGGLREWISNLSTRIPPNYLYYNKGTYNHKQPQNMDFAGGRDIVA